MKTRRAAIVIAGVAIAFGGCAYQNAIYNAERLFDEAEGFRRIGEDSTARVRYDEVIRRTGAAYRARSDADWAGDALFLLGRSRLRIGELEAARGALAEAAARVRPASRPAVLSYQAAAYEAAGEKVRALELANEALADGLGGAALAEAHLVRARLLLAAGHADQAWWDLDRAEEASRPVRVEGGLARLHWAVHHRDGDRADASMARLFSYSEGGARLDTIVTLVDAARKEWGPARAAGLLDPVRSASWDREVRGRVQLVRAVLLDEAGDTAAAAVEAWDVAGRLGVASAEARSLLATWHLRRTRDLADVYAVRPILLPAGADPGIAQLVDAVDELESLTGVGLDGDPLGWFAAGEIARDALGADFVARGLFLAYADGAPGAPWAAKALLAAVQVSESEGDRAWLRGRLEAHAESPYVLAAFGGPAAGFEALEEELEVRLRDIKSR